MRKQKTEEHEKCWSNKYCLRRLKKGNSNRIAFCLFALFIDTSKWHAFCPICVTFVVVFIPVSTHSSVAARILCVRIMSWLHVNGNCNTSHDTRTRFTSQMKMKCLPTEAIARIWLRRRKIALNMQIYKSAKLRSNYYSKLLHMDAN